MEIKVGFNVNTEQLKAAMLKRAEEVQTEELNACLRTMFQPSGYAQKVGVGRELIREKVEKLFEELWDSDAFTKKLEAKVREKFETYVDEAIEVAASHKARKLAFLHVNDKLKGK